jgi:EPS-associated MarR family transcriptional regulator
LQPVEVSHLQLLKLLERTPGLSQRELSRELGVSLGKTHYLLRALVEKGLVKANNFRRNDNKLAYAYLLTPAGVREKIRMTRDYLRRKEVEYEVILAEIDALRSELRSPSDSNELLHSTADQGLN